MEDTRRACPTESTKQGSYGLTEIEVANMGACLGLCQVPCVQATTVSWCFVSLLTEGVRASLALLPAVGNLFHLLGCLAQH